MPDTAVIEKPAVAEVDPIYVPKPTNYIPPIDPDEALERKMAGVPPAPLVNPPTDTAKKEDAKPAEPVAPVATSQKLQLAQPSADQLPPPHPPELIEKALGLDIPIEEITTASTQELRRLVTYVGREVARRQKEPAPVKEVKEEEYDYEANPAGFMPEVIKELRKGADATKALKEIKERLDRTEEQSQRSFLQARDQRLMGLLGQDLAPAFDQRTPAGYAQFGELLATMDGLARAAQSRGKIIDEPALVKKALKALEIEVAAPGEDATKKAALEAKKKEFDAAALGEPNTRKGNVTLEEELLQRKQAIQGKQKTQWLDG